MVDKSSEVQADIVALLRARNPLLWIVTREEARVERYLIEAAAAAKYVTRTWDVAQGVLDPAKSRSRYDDAVAADPGEALNRIREFAEVANQAAVRHVWILRDFPVWLQPPAGALTLRQLRNLVRLLPSTPRDSAQAIVILSPIADVPAELANHATVIEWPLPDREEVADILDAAVEALPSDIRKGATLNGVRDAAIDAAVGLSGEEAASCYAKSLVQLRRIDPVLVAREKKRVIARERVLEWYDPLPGGLAAVGGLANLKAWMGQRSAAYSAEAREYGLPSPRGAMLVGVPGCGKTHIAKAIATAWGVPLLKLDLGSLKSKFVGESEANMRKAFRVIEAIGRCVVLVDEIEKALAGATQGAADGGVSSDALGAILSWMQDRQGEAFVVATANDVEGLPPELTRKGRFDDIWFVDVPTRDERIEVLKAALASHGRGAVKIDFGKVADACGNFTGAEIAALVPEALFTAFADDAREISTGDLIAAAKTVVPLVDSSAEKISKLRAWARERARPASAGETTKDTKRGRERQRVVDL